MTPPVPYIADIKRNALDDGPGVRSVVFFKGCPLSCVWCHNPESIRAVPELLVRAERCIGCKACVAACPEHAIGPEGGDTTDRARCRRSAACVAACPSGARELVGQRYELNALVRLLRRDEVLYRNSGGGVTLSGGEPTLFMEFVGALAQRLAAANVHVLLETSGHFDFERFEEHLAPHLSEIFVDLKLLDPEAHERACGRSNETILANIARMLEGRVPVTVRIPLVPGLTATAENLTAAAAWLRARGVARVVLLAYNPLWAPKASGVGAPLRYEQRGWLTEAEKESARAAFEGFAVEGP